MKSKKRRKRRRKKGASFLFSFGWTGAVRWGAWREKNIPCLSHNPLITAARNKRKSIRKTNQPKQPLVWPKATKRIFGLLHLARVWLSFLLLKTPFR